MALTVMVLSTVIDWPLVIRVPKLGVGTFPLVVYRILARGVAEEMTTVRGAWKVPAEGAKVGFPAFSFVACVAVWVLAVGVASAVMSRTVPVRRLPLQLPLAE